MTDSSPKSADQKTHLAPYPVLRLQAPPHQSATVRRAWQDIARGISERLGLWLPEPVWVDGPDCAIYCRGTRLARIQPESQSVGELTEQVIGKSTYLLSLADTAAILSQLKQSAAAYANEMERLEIPTAFVHSVLKLLLTERVSIADIETILEVLILEWRPASTPEELLERVREALGPMLCEAHASANDELNALTLAPKVEGFLSSKVSSHTLGLEAEAASRFLDTLHEALTAQEVDRVVLLCAAPPRLALARLLERGLPGLPVLSWNEVVNDYGVNVLARVEHRF